MCEPLILGIESSCDETGVGIVRGNDLLANEVASSMEQHVRFGGVVPEVASRAHLEAIVPVLEKATATAGVDLSDLDGVAVTAGPGLAGALVVGLSAAKALARGLTARHDMVKHRFDYSFSGLKTAVSRWVETQQRDGVDFRIADVAASFQEAVADVLTAKAVDMCQEYGLEHFLIGGGVAANSRLRALLAERMEAAGVELRRPRPGLCTDNGAMIAALGVQVVKAGLPASALDISADSGLPIETVLV